MVRHALLIAITTCTLAAMETTMPTITVSDQVIHHLDPRLFGQFMERASWGEPGPEGICDDRGVIRPDAMALLERLAPPIIRFPGGTDIDYINWHDMIDGVPGRQGDSRPATIGHQGGSIGNRFGYDEYFAVRDRLGCQTIIVLNLLDGLLERMPLAEAAQHAAGLVAYCNARQGSSLPDGMPDWPAVRAANGHPEPFGAEFIQLGNEWWCGDFEKHTIERAGHDDDRLATMFITTLHAYIGAIRAVDPQVPLIIDARMPGTISQTVLSDPLIKREVAYTALHAYGPMHAPAFSRDGVPIPADEVDSEEAFWHLSSLPGEYDRRGLNQGFHGWDVYDLAVELGYRMAFTEWNWNGWGYHKTFAKSPLDWRTAAALGVGAMWHGILRNGAHADIATQSMLIGCGWDIAAVHYPRDPADQRPAWYGAQGRCSLFYAEHHGHQLLDLQTSDVPTHQTIYTIAFNQPRTTAQVDALATRSDDQVFVHLVHRHPTAPISLTIDLAALTAGDRGIHWQLLPNAEEAAGPERYLHEERHEVTSSNGQLTITLPPTSISCLAFPLH